MVQPLSDLHFASTGRRFLALILDSLILAIPIGIANLILPFLGGLAVWFFYAPILESSQLQATLGKRLVGIQVADMNGNRISLKTSCIRSASKILSSLLCCFGYLLVFFTARHQTLHDLIADSVVIYGRSETLLVDAWTEKVKEVFRS